MPATKKSANPLAGATMSGADMIIQVIVEQGVDTVFGYSGGAILPTYDAVFRWNKSNPKNELNLIVPANEQGAGFMAAGYARASGKVGVMVITSGPAATNAVTPVRDCAADSIPIVVICGQVARPAIGTDAFQEAPVFSLMSPCAKHVFLVQDESELEATIRSAFYIARTGRPGPVVIDVPKDVQNWQGIFKGEGMLPLAGYIKRMETLQNTHIGKERIKEFLGLLKASKRPLIYAGGGVINGNASDALRKFARHFQIPVVTTLMGIGAVDTTHDLALHMLGMHGAAYANYAVEDCDFLITVGARFDDRVAGLPKQFAPNAKIAHLDIDAAEIGKVKPVQWSHVGELSPALLELLEAGKTMRFNRAAWLSHTQEMKKKHKFDYNRKSDLIQPQEVLAMMNKLTKGEAIVTSGVGQHQMFAAQYLDFKKPRTWLSSGSMGTMGFGLPAAVGAQFAHPDKLVIDVDGDGSLRMNLGEMETCTTYNLPIKILLLNNLGDGMVVQWQSLYFQGRFSGSDKSLRKKTFVKAAQADGFKFARCVERKQDLEKALKEWLACDGPAFLEVMTDKYAFVYPMVGPGLSYKDMLTGPYIKGREKEREVADLEMDASDSFYSMATPSAPSASPKTGAAGPILEKSDSF